MTDGRRRAFTLLLVAVLGSYSLARLDLTNSITYFMPQETENEIVALSLELVESPLSRRMVLAVEGGPTSRVVAEELADALAEHPEVEWVERGFDASFARALYDLYFERRFYLASNHPSVEIPAWTSNEALAERARRAKVRIAQPDGMLVARTLGADPLGLSERMLARIEASRPSGGGQGADETFATLQIGLRSSPFDSRVQMPFLEFIEAEFARIAERHGGGLWLDQNGVNRFAVSAERTIRGDVNLISSVSMIVVVALFLLVFRSLKQLGIAFLVPLGGFAAAMAVAVSGGEAVHGITLGFGFALIGVAIDYPIHLMNHHALATDGSSIREVRDSIRSSMLLSGLTTTLAFSSLALSDFPGLSGMGRFGGLGVLVALAMTLLLLPSFLNRPVEASPTQLRLASTFEALVEGLVARRGLALAMLLGAGLLAGIGVPRLVWQDDPSSLMATDPDLLAEADRVRARVADFEGTRFVVALAEDAETALELNADVAARLEGLIAEGQLEAMGSLHSFLWPASLQRANRAAFEREAMNGALADRVERAFVEQGFRGDAFGDFRAALEETALPPLTREDLLASPLARVLDAHVELEGRHAIVTFLRGVESSEAMEVAFAGLEGAYYVDQKALVADLYEGYRRSTIQRVAMGAGIVLLVLFVRYRNFARGLLAFLPAGLATLCTLGVFGLAGIPVNVASAVSLLVILGMGVDYGIFAVDASGRAARQGATLSSLLISCVTSIFVFGVLALSAQPVLQSIGLTTGLGVLFALVLSPIVLALAADREEVPT